MSDESQTLEELYNKHEALLKNSCGDLWVDLIHEADIRERLLDAMIEANRAGFQEGLHVANEANPY